MKKNSCIVNSSQYVELRGNLSTKLTTKLPTAQCVEGRILTSKFSPNNQWTEEMLLTPLTNLLIMDV